jgi:hypothetical protein
MSDLSWHYRPVGTWQAARGRVDFRISISSCGTFLACQYLDGSWVSESRWKTLDQAKDWCNSQKIGGES